MPPLPHFLVAVGRTMVTFYLTLIDAAPSSVVQPFSQSTPMERRTPADNWLNMCLLSGSGGSAGRTRRQV